MLHPHVRFQKTMAALMQVNRNDVFGRPKNDFGTEGNSQIWSERSTVANPCPGADWAHFDRYVLLEAARLHRR